MRLVRVGTRFVNLDTMTVAIFNRKNNELELYSCDEGSVATFKGDQATLLTAYLCNQCEAQLGDDLPSLLLERDKPKEDNKCD